MIDDDVEDVNNNRTPIKNSVLKPSIYRLGMCIRLWWDRFAVYVEANRFPPHDWVNKSFLDDDCLLMAKYALMDKYNDLEQLRKRVMKLFAEFPGELQTLRSRFYARQQLENENLRVFMTKLWRMAEEAFLGKAQHVIDGVVRDQFIFG